MFRGPSCEFPVLELDREECCERRPEGRGLEAGPAKCGRFWSSLLLETGILDVVWSWLLQVGLVELADY